MVEKVDVILGVDFGTRFSKVCYRILDGSKPQIVTLEIAGKRVSIVDSMLWIDPKHGFVGSLTLGRSKRLMPLRYLKMLLMGDEQAGQQRVLELSFMRPLNDTIPALACYLLFQIIRRSMLQVLSQERLRDRDKQVNWSLNLSIPAQFANDGLLPLFQEVGSVAMLWSQIAIGGSSHDLLTPTVDAIRARYSYDVPEASDTVDVSVTPEIISALHHFLMRAHTPVGVHGFVDIGAGTIDACVFRLNRTATEPKIPILNAKVISLGTASIANKATMGKPGISSERLETALVEHTSIPAEFLNALVPFEKPLKNFIATLVIGARDALLGRALVHDPASFVSGDRSQLNRRFRFYSTGGAARSYWYRNVLQSVHAERNMTSHNVMAWDIGPAAAPAEFPQGYDFSRFIIAWGLTGEGADLQALKVYLPNDVGVSEPLPERRPAIPLYEGR